MSRPLNFGSALSVIALTSMVGACATASGNRVQGTTAFGGTVDQANIGLATKAMLALQAKNYSAAITYGERAVANTPTDAGFRAVLGNAYFAGGRFASAEAAYRDSLALMSDQPPVILKLVLAQIAQGRSVQAVQFLSAARDVLDPADFGLALALAGRPSDAVAFLDAAARTAGADARVRQNLALAYALSGDWPQARTVAAQDLPGDKLDARMREWMVFAKPGHASDQVASLTGVTPVAVDPGQPTRLALRDAGGHLAAVATPASAPMAPVVPAVVAVPAAPIPAMAAAPAIAQVEPQAPAVVAFAEPTETLPPAAPIIAPPLPAPHRARAPQPAPAAAPSPAAAAIAAAAAMAPEAPAAFAAAMAQSAAYVRRAHKAPLRPASASLPRPAFQHATFRRTNGGSTAVVQLGAYGTPERVASAWSIAARRFASLRPYAPMSARFAGPRGMVYRLSLKGFASDREARLLCETIKRANGNCFVRSVAGDAPVALALR